MRLDSSLRKFAFRIALLALLCSAVLVGSPSAQTTGKTQPAAPADKPRISKQQADELFRSVDDILKWVSQDSGLPIKHPVKRALASRGEGKKYVEDRMKDDEDAKRLARSQLVLKKFGLVPRQFDLGKFLVELLREQVVGF